MGRTLAFLTAHSNTATEYSTSYLHGIFFFSLTKSWRFKGAELCIAFLPAAVTESGFDDENRGRMKSCSRYLAMKSGACV